MPLITPIDTDVEQSLLLLLLELEMAAPRLRWCNASAGWRIVVDEAHLSDLLSHVGTSEAFQFLTVEPIGEDDRGSRYAQACGDARGLAVEVGFGLEVPSLVSPIGAAHAPRVDIGQHGWLYLVNGQETHTVRSATSIMLCYLETGQVPTGYELRSVEGRC